MEELILNIQLESHRNLLFQHSPYPAVVFDRHYNLRRNRCIGQIASAARLHKHSAASARARLNSGDTPFLKKNFWGVLIKFVRFPPPARRSASLSRSTA